MDEQDRYELGLSVRREVLGAAHVDRALSQRGEFDGEFQELLTRFAWGDIWSRPGLPRRTRSLLTVAMLVALNRPEELRLHLHQAARNGVSRDELKEALLQAAVYCGIPAANAAFRLVREEEASGGPLSAAEATP